MSTGPVTVEADGFRITSNSETAEDMIASLSPPDPKAREPREVKPEGAKDEEKEPSPISKAASELGKRGAKAAAKAREAAEKDKAPTKAAEPAKAAETKAGEGQGDTDEDEDVYDTPELKARAAETVKRATLKLAETKREAARLKAENEDLRRSRDARPNEAVRPPERRETPAEAEVKAPVLKEFTDKHDSFEEGLAAYLEARDAHRDGVRERREAQKAEREQILGTVKTFQEAIKEAEASDPDFWDNVPEIHDSTPLGQEIVRAGGNAPGILRYLSENPEMAEKLSKSSDLREVIREVGKIEDRIARATTGDTRATDRPGPNPEPRRAKPHPVKPVTGTPHADSGELGDDAPLSAVVRAFGERELRASGR